MTAKVIDRQASANIIEYEIMLAHRHLPAHFGERQACPNPPSIERYGQRVLGK